MVIDADTLRTLLAENFPNKTTTTAEIRALLIDVLTSLDTAEGDVSTLRSELHRTRRRHTTGPIAETLQALASADENLRRQVFTAHAHTVLAGVRAAVAEANSVATAATNATSLLRHYIATAREALLHGDLDGASDALAAASEVPYVSPYTVDPEVFTTLEDLTEGIVENKLAGLFGEQ